MARKKTKPFRVDTAFNPEGFTICPLCWSRPSVEKRYKVSGLRGWGLTQVEKIVKWKDRVYGYVYHMKYPCSNDDCLGHIVIETMGSEMGREGTEHLHKKHQLTGENATKYEAGHTDKNGVWHGTAAPPVIEVVKTEPVKRKARVAKTPEPEPTIAEPKKRKPRAAPAAPRKGTQAPRKGAAKPKAPKVEPKAAKKPRKAKAAKPTKRTKA